MSAEGRRVPRIALGAWLLLALVVWNVRFDYGIRIAANAYLARAQRAYEGRGPQVTIDEVMRPAAGASARDATLWSVAIAGPGLAALAWVSRRRSTASLP